MEILAVIPARSGSKGLVDKNILLLKGHPLLSYSIAAATSSNLVTRVICSTDSRSYAEIAIKYGAEVPFLRPKKYALHNSSDFEVFFHLLNKLNKREKYLPDLVVQLRPTSPLRYPGMVDEAIKSFKKMNNIDSLRGVSEPDHSPYKMWTVGNDQLLQPLLRIRDNPEPYNTNRQDLPEIFAQTGSIEVVRLNTILIKMSMTGKKIMPFFIPNEYFIDIDNQTGLTLCESLLDELTCIRPDG